jgi:4-amino-4-deoxy-L-arabinose transferase-like glycosyltransferase
MKFLRTIALVLPAAYILLYVVLALWRISYPYELEWQEGSMVDHVRRVLLGLPLYTMPSVEWVAAIYPPLYYWVCAGVALLTGIGFWPLRLVSFLASLGCMVVLFDFVRRETEDKWAGITAAGLFAALYSMSSAWLDLARVDSLFLFLLLAGIWALRYLRTRAGYILAALLIALSVLTKQTALLPAIFLIAYGIYRRKEHGWYFVLPLLIFTVVPMLLLNSLSDGWFAFYVFQVPAGHALIGHAFAEFWLHDIFRPLAFASLFGLFFLFERKANAARSDWWFYILVGAGFFAASWVPRVKDGNWANDLLPAYAFLSLLFGLAIPMIRQRLKDNVIVSFFYAAVILQFAVLYYRPLDLVPSTADRRAGESLISEIRRTEGEVWIAHHGCLGSLAGKRMYASALPIYDILRAKSESAKTLLLDSIERALKERRFTAIYTDNERFVNLNEFREYRPRSAVFSDQKVFWPVSGAPTRPLRIYVPRSVNE